MGGESRGGRGWIVRAGSDGPGPGVVVRSGLLKGENAVAWGCRGKGGGWEGEGKGEQKELRKAVLGSS